MRIIPVLIGGAQMPEAGTLPSELKPLAKRQAIEIRHEHFSADVDAVAASDHCNHARCAPFALADQRLSLRPWRSRSQPLAACFM